MDYVDMKVKFTLQKWGHTILINTQLLYEERMEPFM